MTISRAYAMEHFDEICARAARGEEIVLDTPGEPTLKLVPRNDEAQDGSSPAAVASMLEFARSLSRCPGKIDYRELIEEGRRY